MKTFQMAVQEPFYLQITFLDSSYSRLIDSIAELQAEQPKTVETHKKNKVNEKRTKFNLYLPGNLFVVTKFHCLPGNHSIVTMFYLCLRGNLFCDTQFYQVHLVTSILLPCTISVYLESSLMLPRSIFVYLVTSLLLP